MWNQSRNRENQDRGELPEFAILRAAAALLQRQCRGGFRMTA